MTDPRLDPDGGGDDQWHAVVLVLVATALLMALLHYAPGMGNFVVTALGIAASINELMPPRRRR